MIRKQRTIFSPRGSPRRQTRQNHRPEKDLQQIAAERSAEKLLGSKTSIEVALVSLSLPTAARQDNLTVRFRLLA
jgi:preprotein translocase subunit SecD